MALGKAHVDYWKKRLTKRRFRRNDGTTYENPDYEIRLSLGETRTYFNLKSSNKDTAAREAQKIWEFHRVNGTEETLKKFKPESQAPKEKAITVGDVLAAHEAIGIIKPRTLVSYQRKFRNLVAGVMKIKGTAARHDYVKGGREKWRQKVDSVPLHKITPEKMMRWRNEYLKQAKPDPISQRSARVTADSILRNSKALFSQKALKALPLNIERNPFTDVPIGSVSTKRHKSEVDFKVLAEAARNELTPPIPPFVPLEESKKDHTAYMEAVSKHQQFKILLLSLGCGLRRGEIDTLLKKNINFENHTIHVTTSEFGSIKSEDGDRIVDVSEEILLLLKEYMEEETGNFVIVSNVKARPEATYYHYRCSKHFEGLVHWLRTQGITKRSAIHALRAEYGSNICQQFGIYAASRALGHSNVTITAASYLDKREKVSVSLF